MKSSTGKNRKPRPKENVADLISAVLRHPDTPVLIYNDLSDSLCELFNRLPSSAKLEVTDSPAYVGQVLKLYAERGRR